MPYRFHYVHCLRFSTDTELFLSSVTRSRGMHGKLVTDAIVVILLLLMRTHTVRCKETSGNGIHMGSGSGSSSGGSGDVDSSSTTTSIMPSVSPMGPTSTNKSPPNSPTYTGHTTSTPPPIGSKFKLVLIVAGVVAGALLLPILLLCCCCCWYYCKKWEFAKESCVTELHANKSDYVRIVLL